MRRLTDVPNIGGVQPGVYPDGVIIDAATSVTGTALTVQLYGDLIQTVYKLKRMAGVTENGQPDNESTGFQMLETLLRNMVPVWQPATTGPGANLDFSNVKWVTYNNGLYYHRTAVNTNTNPAVDTVNWFRVLYWNGSTIVYSDESRIADIEDDINNLETDVADVEADISSLQSAVSTNTTNVTHAISRNSEQDDRLDLLENDTGWLNCTPGSAAASATFRARQVGRLVVLYGEFEMVGTAASIVLLTLPTGIGAPSEFIYFGAIGNDGGAPHNARCILTGSSKQVLVQSPTRRSNTPYHFNMSYFVD